MPQSPRQRKNVAERDRRVIELRSRGLSFEQIAKAGIDGVSSRQQAWKCFERGIENIPKVAAEQYRALENEKLDVAERRIMAIMANQDTETKDTIRAAQTFVAIAKRRADLNGLDLVPTHTDGLGISTVYVDTSVLLKSRSQPGDEPTAEELAAYEAGHGGDDTQ